MSLAYSVVPPVSSGVSADPVWMTALAQHLEALGFESIVAVEHTVLATRYSSRYPYDVSGRVGIPAHSAVPDPLELLTFLAARTETLGLATGVLVLPNHHPVVLAKRVATLSALSGGRIRLAVGTGWLREELEACDVPFEARGRRADEQIDVLRLLWSDQPDGADHHGEFFDFTAAASYPKPVSPVPIHIGGHSRAAARRAGRRGEGLQPMGAVGADLAELVTVMRQSAEQAGRDPDALELSLGHMVTKIDADRADKLAALGAHRAILAMPEVTDINEAKDVLSACADRLGLAPCP